MEPLANDIAFESSARSAGPLSVADVLGPKGLLAKTLSSYEHRASQLEMAQAVSRALGREDTLIVEAGTGTGKTLAYLVPALLSGKKVVISTGTKALQDQIMEHDVPLLTRVLGRPLDIACMKGLANYLCLRRYNEHRHSARAGAQRDAAQIDLLIDRTVPGAPAAARPIQTRQERELAVLQAWAERTELGDRSELSVLGDDASIWAEVHSGTDTRIGPKCQYHDACFVTRMRKRAQDADIIVVNHHLYFADLALRGAHGGGVIPDHAAVVFDEAHLIEDIATDFFGVSVSTTRLTVLVRDADRTLAAARLGGESARWLTQVTSAGAELFATLPQPFTADGSRVPLARSAWEDRLQAPMLALDNALDGLASFCKQRLEHGEAIAQIARRADQLRDDIASIAEGGGGGRVTWVVVRGNAGKNRGSVSFGASPIAVADILRDKLFQRAQGVVLTSATLATSGNFDYVRSRLGIDWKPEEKLLPSPFDFPKQAALYVPERMPDPREAGFLDAAEHETAALIEITGGGAFVLCTSLKVMRALAERLAKRLTHPVLVQGSAPHAVLLDRFRKHGDAVLVATSSFWQGVDVPGRALRLVIIDKLPFEVPSDPLVAARCEKLEEAGEQPFMKYLVPAAALTLKQGFGRLIRSAEDRGIVAILDTRITKKGYGRTFISSLPPATRCLTLDAVRDFYASAQPK